MNRHTYTQCRLQSINYAGKCRSCNEKEQDRNDIESRFASMYVECNSHSITYILITVINAFASRSIYAIVMCVCVCRRCQSNRQRRPPLRNAGIFFFLLHHVHGRRSSIVIDIATKNWGQWRKLPMPHSI